MKSAWSPHEKIIKSKCMGSKRRYHEIKVIMLSTWRKHEIYKTRSRNLHDEIMISTWREHDIYMNRAWDL